MKKIFIPSLLAATVALSGCDDFLSAYSQDQIVAKEVSHFDEVILGSGYLQSVAIADGPSVGNVGGFFNVLDDDVNTGRDRVVEGQGESNVVSKAWLQAVESLYGYFGWQQEVGTNSDGSLIRDDAGTWDKLYEHINVTNVILYEIQDLPHSTETDEATFYRVQGEAHFLRAQFYFTLANLYGDVYDPQTCYNKPCVPLKLNPDVEFEFTRASVGEVYDQIVADLTTAEDYLTRSPQNPDHFLHRASVEAVQLLLSRVYLYMQKWDLAEQKAKAVMESENFYLAPISSFQSDVPFLTDENQEVIFSQGSNNLSCLTTFTARPGDFCVTKELYDLFSDNDRRKSCFFATYYNDEGSVVDNDSIQLAYKYERGNSLRAHISDCFALRMSEAWLNRAEALAMLHRDGEAMNLLNEFRKQRIDGYVDLAYTGNELVDEIRTERRKELCFEGHRWFDLRRYAVNAEYPYAKTLVHAYNVVGDGVGYMYTRTLVLPPGDKSYTFALPKSVVNFFEDGSLTTNPRDVRTPLEDQETDEPEEEEGEGGFPETPNPDEPEEGADEAN